MTQEKFPEADVFQRMVAEDLWKLLRSEGSSQYFACWWLYSEILQSIADAFKQCLVEDELSFEMKAKERRARKSQAVNVEMNEL
jgi:hypothetical protein